MFLVLKGAVWREMSGGCWNSTKPGIKGVFCKVNLDLETCPSHPKSPGLGELTGFDYQQRGAPGPGSEPALLLPAWQRLTRGFR